MDRLSPEAPLREAVMLMATEGYGLGDEFVIVRRFSGMFPLRWDACRMEVTAWGPNMVQVGFGMTRRGALRHMRRSEPFRLHHHLTRGDTDAPEL